jgi:hypothetical protein
MRVWSLAAVVLLCSGCTHFQLQRSTVRQQRTLADLNCQQVLDNVAHFVNNPDSMPFFSYAATGTTQISDAGTANVTLTWDPRTIISEALGITGSRTVVEGWNLSAINDPDRLYGMRCVYRMVVGAVTTDCDDCVRRLDAFFNHQFMSQAPCLVPLGWFQVGCQSEVPKCACYVSQCGGKYVWVTPDGLDGLTRLTFTILDIAAIAPSSGGPVQPQMAPGPLGTERVPSEQPFLRPREFFVPLPGPTFFPQPPRR